MPVFLIFQGQSKATRAAALDGSVYAANYNAPIILVDGSLPDQMMNYRKGKNLTGAAILGGEAVVDKDIEQQVKDLIKE